MSQATPLMRSFAKRLIGHEAGGNKSAPPHPPAGFQSCEMLRLHLTTLMGSAGFRTLLLRSLALALREVPWLRAVRVKADGALEGLEELQAKLDRDTFLEGGVVLLAHLLGLLIAFIGGNLTVRVVREVWPKIPLNDLELVN